MSSFAQDPIHPLAKTILRAFDSGKRMPVDGSVESVEDAYKVQAAVALQKGPVAGFKAARKPGAVPMSAPIMTAGLVASGGSAASLFGGGLGVELEVGLRLIGPLPAADDPGFMDALRACVQPVVVIELVDTRLAGPLAEETLNKLADAQVNAGLVVGPDLPDWDGGPISQIAARMRVGDTVLLDGPANVPGGDARESLRALAAALGDHCGGLQPGQIVITGSLHPLTYVAPGTLVEGWIEGFGAISVSIT